MDFLINCNIGLTYIYNLKKYISHQKTIKLIITLLLVFTTKINAQDIAAMYKYGNTAEDVREFLFDNTSGQLNLLAVASHYKTQASVFANEIYDPLSCTGDFDGDGKDEVALFVKMNYTPNCLPGDSCPPYSTTNVILLKSNGQTFYPIGSWYSELDTVLDAENIRFAVSGDYNNDGKSDITLVYSDEATTSALLVLKSNGNSFLPAEVFFNAMPTSFKLDSIIFTLGGDYNADGYADMAMLYKHNLEKNISIFTSNGSVFNAAEVYYTFPDSLKLQQIRFAQSGRFTADMKSDIALLYKSDYQSPGDSGNIILVLKAETDSFANPKTYTNISSTIDNYDNVFFSATSDFNNDGLSDIVLSFNTQLGNPVVQKILVYHSNDSSFASPISYWSDNINEFNFYKVSHLVTGNFTYEPKVKVCTWQGNKKGALTFSFDDGYTPTIDNAKYLYTKGVLGSHNIITQLSGTGHYADWPAIQADSLGNEYGSHSYTHAFLNHITLCEAANELAWSKQELDSHLPTTAVSFVFPGGAFSNEVMHLPQLRNNYMSARTSMHGYNLSTPNDVYALKSRVILNTTTPATTYGWIDNTVNYGYWTFLMYHFINYQGSDPELIEYNSSIANFRATVDYACQQDLWISSQEHIIKYIKERNALKPVSYAIVNSDSLKLILNDFLNDNVYNVPLTIQVVLPISWMVDSVLVIQNGNTKKYPVSIENGKPYSYINCLPNNSEVFVINYNATSGIAETGDNKKQYSMTVYPNPTNSIAMIKFNQPIYQGDIYFYNAIGQKTKSITNFSGDKIMISRDNLASGLYFIKVTQDRKIVASERLLITE
ncbi:T9SS type A sorting domain-containing protein [candidate division KSB1 bacterium]